MYVCCSQFFVLMCRECIVVIVVMVVAPEVLVMLYRQMTPVLLLLKRRCNKRTTRRVCAGKSELIHYHRHRTVPKSRVADESAVNHEQVVIIVTNGNSGKLFAPSHSIN